MIRRPPRSPLFPYTTLFRSVYVKQEFPAFYRAMFDQQVRLNRMETVFTEYAWDMGWCDPCAAEPMSASELGQLGVLDRKSTRLNSSHTVISYAVFCLKKKKK